MPNVQTIRATTGAKRVHPVVHTKRNWMDPWKPADYLVPVQAVHAASPTLSSAKLRWRYGEVRWEDERTWRDRLPLSLANAFVRIAMATEGNPLPVPVWYGYITEQHWELMASGATTWGGWQLLEAWGLEALLHTTIVRQACVKEPGEAAVHVLDWVPPFNRESHKANLLVTGTRSSAVVAGDVGKGVYAHSLLDGAVWRPSDVARWLLAHYGPTTGFCTGMYWELAGETENLDIATGAWNLEGLPVAAALERVIDRRRGMGWCLETDGTTVWVRCYSGFDQAVKAGSVELKPNPNVVDLALDNADAVAEAVVSQRHARRARRVRAVGARVKSTFSVDYDTGLESGWSASDEAAVENAGSTLMEAELRRTLDVYDRVFCAHRIVRDWDWQTRGGGNANPAIGEDGLTHYDEAPASTWTLGKRFERHVPYADEWEACAVPRYLPPLAFVRHPECAEELEANWKYVRLDKPPTDAGGGAFDAVGLRVAEDELGILLTANPVYLMGKGTYTGAWASGRDPLYDYRTLILTATVELDSRVQYVVEMPDRADDGPPLEVLVELPDAELWLVAQGTVKGLQADGTLEVEATNTWLRDDREKVIAAALLAATWYGVPRTEVRATLHGIELAPRVGQLLRAVLARDVLGLESHSVVTQVVHDFGDRGRELGRTQLVTQYGELDAAAMVL